MNNDIRELTFEETGCVAGGEILGLAGFEIGDAFIGLWSGVSEDNTFTVTITTDDAYYNFDIPFL